MNRDKYVYPAEILRVIDGDTVEARLDCGDLGFNLVLYTTQILRLHGINAPEVRGSQREQGLAATAHLKQLIDLYQPLVVETIKDKQGKYGRYLAILRTANPSNLKSPLSLNQQMVTDGHALAKKY